MQHELHDHPRHRDATAHLHALAATGPNGLGLLEELAASTDGSRFALTAAAHQQLAGRPARRLWLLDAAGGGPLSLASDHAEFHPRFSPDGATLAFLSDRGHPGIMQLQFRPLASPQQIQAAPLVDGTVEWFAWSADGTRILLLAAGLGADRASAQGSGALAGAAPRESWQPKFDPRDTGDNWRVLWVLDVAAGQLSRVSEPGVNVWEAAWCGAGGFTAIVSDRPHEGAWYAARLVSGDIGGGATRSYGMPFGDQLGTPAATPSGNRLAAISAFCSDRMVVAGDVVIVDRDKAPATAIDLGGLQVTWLAWRSDTRLVCIGFVDFETVAVEYDIDTASWRQLWRGSENICGGAVHYARATLVPDDGIAVLLESYRQPPTPSVLRGGNVQVLHEPESPAIDHMRAVTGEMRQVRWAGRDGLEIQGWLATPGTPGPYPLVVLAHGGPVWAFRNSWSMAYLFTPLLVQHGYAVLHPNPRGSAGRDRAFAQMVRGDMGGEDAHDIIQGVRHLIAEGIADASRIGTMGRSYGGYISAWMTVQSDLFAASIAMNNSVDWYSRHFTSNAPEFQQQFLPCSPFDVNGLYFDRSALLRAREIKTPTLIVVGANDFGAPPTQGLMLNRALRETGTDSFFVMYPEEGHHVLRLEAQIDLLARCLIWFDRYMPAAT